MQAGSTTLVAGEDMNRVMDSGSIPLTFSDLISTARPGSWAELGEVDLDSSIADVSSWVQFDSLVRYGISCPSRFAELTDILQAISPFGDFRPASYQ
jgi:hypothetical protein